MSDGDMKDTPQDTPVGTIEEDVSPDTPVVLDNDTDTPAEATTSAHEYVTREHLADFEKSLEQMVNSRMSAFEDRMTTFIKQTIDNAEFVRRYEMIHTIKETLGDYPTVNETKALVNQTKAAFDEEIKPLAMELKLINNQLARIVALDGTVQSVVRDVGSLREGHEQQQTMLSHLAATVAHNTNQISKLYTVAETNRDLIQSNQKSLATLQAIVPKVEDMSEYILQEKTEKEMRRARRKRLIETAKETLKSSKLWGGVAAAAGAATFELLRQAGVWDGLLEAFVP